MAAIKRPPFLCVKNQLFMLHHEQITIFTRALSDRAAGRKNKNNSNKLHGPDPLTSSNLHLISTRVVRYLGLCKCYNCAYGMCFTITSSFLIAKHDKADCRANKYLSKVLIFRSFPFELLAVFILYI